MVLYLFYCNILTTLVERACRASLRLQGHFSEDLDLTVLKNGKISTRRRVYNPDLDMQEVQGQEQAGSGEVQEVRIQVPQAEEQRAEGQEVILIHVA